MASHWFMGGWLRCMRRYAIGHAIWLSAVHCIGQDTWHWDRDPNPAPIGDRVNHAVAWTGSELIVWGGARVVDGLTQELVDTGAVYHPETRTWRIMSSVGAPSPRTDSSVVWTGTQLLIWGGYGMGGTLGDGACYDPLEDRWTPMSPTGAPFQRYYHSTVWTGSEMIVWGGNYFFGGNHGGTLDDGGRYNPTTDTWKPIPSTTPSPLRRHHHSSVWTGSRILLFGGEYWGGDMFDLKVYPFNDLWSLDPSSNFWELLSTEGPGYRTSCSVAWSGAELLVWGGRGGLSMLGGYVMSPEYLLADGWRYSPATRSWAAMKTNSQPAKRAGAPAFWTGSEFLVLGGSTDSSVTPSYTGGRYDPATDQWRALNTNGTPAFPDGLVWTGSGIASYTGGSRTPPAHDLVYTYSPPGLYAGDEIPDEWQRSYFGEDNPNGLPAADPDHDGQDNATEYLAGTLPNDPTSKLRFAVKQSDNVLQFTFAPFLADRVYTLEGRYSISVGAFEPLPEGLVSDRSEERTITLPMPIAGTLFVRLVLRR